jgi:predicted metal-dependent hydrolase/CheY-like chemotaxis protein
VTDAPLILALVSDLFFSVQVENAARGLGFRVRQVADGRDVEPPEPGEPEPPAQMLFRTEPLTGPGARFVARLAEWQPALVLVELSSRQIPWAQWVAAMKASSATRRIPVLAFGPHTDLELRERALDAGCDAVVAKSRLVTALPELIQQYARQVDQREVEAACRQPLPPLAIRGIELFNAGEYFEAHEELEHAWVQEAGPARELYRGILQVAVAYLQITRRNYRGALKMFLRLRQWLDPLPDQCQGVDVAQLRTDALRAREHLEALGPDGIQAFDLGLLRPVRYSARPGPNNGHKPA